MSSNFTVNTNFIHPEDFDSQRVFDHLLAQLGPANPLGKVEIQGSVYKALGEDLQEFFLDVYAVHTGQQAMYVRDAAINRVFLGPRAFLEAQPLLYVAGQIPVLISTAGGPGYSHVPTLVASPASTTSVSSSQAAGGNAAPSATAAVKVRRPPNAFILYRQARHASTVLQNPGVHNNQISVIIGAKWSTEAPEVRADFKAQAEKLKQEHMRLYPNYTYKPRKPSEKKRRLSKKKAEALLANQLAAENRAKSMKSVDQYPMMERRQHGQIVTTFKQDRFAHLPLPDLPSNVLLQAIQPTPNRETAAPGCGLTPSADYEAAQAADMSFFPELDFEDPAYIALCQDVEEARKEGYYNDCLVDEGAQDFFSDDYNYVLENYSLD